MNFKNPYKNNLQKKLLQKWGPNSFHPNSYEPQEERDCSPYDCMCGIYDNTYENYFYSHRLNPAQQYFSWIYQWKEFHWELHQDLIALGQTNQTDDYVRGYLDAVSYEYPLNRFTMDEDMGIPIR
jgi:hypothetical protein